MNTETNNALIAEFMGAKNVAQNLYEYKETPTEYSSYQWNSDRMNYNKSWDWLMPVVEKIKESNVVHVDEGYEIIDCLDERLLYVDIAGVYHRVVEFITWYNLNK